VTAAQSGGVGKRPSERKRDAEERAGGGAGGGYGGQGGYGGGGRGGDRGESYGNFSSNREREPYGDAWAGKSGGGRGGGNTCYNCGEVSARLRRGVTEACTI
jgi:hypothetical protein